MDFDEITNLLPDTGSSEDRKGVGSPPPLGCIVIMILIGAGLLYGAWKIWG